MSAILIDHVLGDHKHQKPKTALFTNNGSIPTVMISGNLHQYVPDLIRSEPVGDTELIKAFDGKQFTAPSNGVYNFNISLRWYKHNINSLTDLSFISSSMVCPPDGLAKTSGVGNNVCSTSIMLHLGQGDTVTVMGFSDMDWGTFESTYLITLLYKTL